MLLAIKNLVVLTRATPGDLRSTNPAKLTFFDSNSTPRLSDIFSPTTLDVVFFGLRRASEIGLFNFIKSSEGLGR